MKNEVSLKDFNYFLDIRTRDVLCYSTVHNCMLYLYYIEYDVNGFKVTNSVYSLTDVSLNRISISTRDEILDNFSYIFSEHFKMEKLFFNMKDSLEYLKNIHIKLGAQNQFSNLILNNYETSKYFPEYVL